MELYFEKPALVRVFYYKNATDFTCYHTHDMDLKLERENVVYLYRNPVDTIYSQLRYYKEDIDDKVRRRYWVRLYAKHLTKWLIEEDFTKKKAIITYEGMRIDMIKEFTKVVQHFGNDLNLRKLENALLKVNKNELKKKTKHDKQVVNMSSEYQLMKNEFSKKYTEEIFSEIYSFEPELKKWFC